jgi:hypothetical protein
MSTTTGIQIAHVSRRWDRDSPNLYKKKQRLTMLMDMRRGTETPLSQCQEKPLPCHQRLPLLMSKETLLLIETSFWSGLVNRCSSYPCQENPHSALPMETETPLIHVKTNLFLICPCQHRLPLPMSRVSSFCSVYSMSTEIPLTHVKRNLILLCLQYVNRDSPYPCQEKAHSALSTVCKQRFPLPMSRESSFCSVYSMSTEIPLTHVKRNLILLCLQYVNRDSPYPSQEKPHSALSTVCQQRLPLPMSRETSSVLSMSTGTPLPLIHVKRNLTLLAHANRDSPYPCQQKRHSALPMSTEIPLTHIICSVYSMSTETPFTHVKRNLILLCLQYVNRDSLYPCQEKARSALSTVCRQRLPLPMSRETSSVLSMSTGTPLPLIHVKKNLTLLCPCQQRLPLPMSTETTLCSAPRLPLHISRETEAHSALPMSTIT